MTLRLSSLFILLSALVWPVISQQLAFPGAEGFGRYATGGRDGSVYVVTNLEEEGEGSLRDAVSKSDRIVVFAVGGTINITDRLVVSERVSILGQTAPGGGITTYGNGWSFSNAHNSIVRYVRIRMGKNGDRGKDAVTIADGENMIFDHLSVSWGRDETFSISGDVKNITIQNSIIGQGLVSHSCGGLIQTDGGVSLFRNLYIDNKTRNPKVKGVNDFTNNVVYNWGGGGGYIAGGSSSESFVHVIGNYFVSGPETKVTAFTRGNDKFHAYVKGNFYDSDKDGELNGSELGESSTNYGGMDLVTEKYDYPAPEKILDAAAALKYVSGHAGASLVRDSVDTQLVKQLQSFGKEGKLISDEKDMGGPGYIEPGTTPKDTDNDGIPDDAEKKLGTDSSKDDSMDDKDGNGYVNVEDWANSLVPSGYE